MAKSGITGKGGEKPAKKVTKHRKGHRDTDFTAERKAAFLELFAASGRVAESAREVGVSMVTVLQAKDPLQPWYDAEFAIRYAEAHEIYVNALERAAHERAVDGVDEARFDKNGNIVGHVRKYSDGLLTTLLKAKSERYREKVDVDQRIWHSGQVTFSADLEAMLGALSKAGRAKLREVLREFSAISDNKVAEDRRELPEGTPKSRG